MTEEKDELLYIEKIVTVEDFYGFVKNPDEYNKTHQESPDNINEKFKKYILANYATEQEAIDAVSAELQETLDRYADHLLTTAENFPKENEYASLDDWHKVIQDNQRQIEFLLATSKELMSIIWFFVVTSQKDKYETFVEIINGVRKAIEGSLFIGEFDPYDEEPEE